MTKISKALKATKDDLSHGAFTFSSRFSTVWRVQLVLQANQDFFVIEKHPLRLIVGPYANRFCNK